MVLCLLLRIYMKNFFILNRYYKIGMFSLLLIFGVLDIWASFYWQKPVRLALPVTLES